MELITAFSLSCIDPETGSEIRVAPGIGLTVEQADSRGNVRARTPRVCGAKFIEKPEDVVGLHLSTTEHAPVLSCELR